MKLTLNDDDYPITFLSKACTIEYSCYTILVTLKVMYVHCRKYVF